MKIFSNFKSWFSKAINIVFLGIIIFLGITIFAKNIKINNLEYSLEKCLNSKPVIEYIYKTDTIEIYQEVPKPIYINNTDTIKDTITIDLDKNIIWKEYLALRKKYYEKKVYDSVLVNDSLLYANLAEDVVENTLYRRKFEYQIKGPAVILQTNKIIERNHMLLGGIEAGTPGVFLSTMYKTPADNIYKLSYDPINKLFLGGVYFKILKIKDK